MSIEYYLLPKLSDAFTEKELNKQILKEKASCTQEEIY